MKDSAGADDIVVRFSMSHTHFVKKNDYWIFKLIGLKSRLDFFYNYGQEILKEVITYLTHFLTSNLKYKHCFSCAYFLFQL